MDCLIQDQASVWITSMLPEHKKMVGTGHVITPWRGGMLGKTQQIRQNSDIVLLCIYFLFN